MSLFKSGWTEGLMLQKKTSLKYLVLSCTSTCMLLQHACWSWTDWVGLIELAEGTPTDTKIYRVGETVSAASWAINTFDSSQLLQTIKLLHCLFFPSAVPWRCPGIFPVTKNTFQLGLNPEPSTSQPRPLRVEQPLLYVPTCLVVFSSAQMNAFSSRKPEMKSFPPRKKYANFIV